jgi:DNA-binding NtrC family response regulator
MNILLLEDHYEAAKIALWLNKRGYKVHRAQNIMDAEDLLDSDIRFDAAVLDLDMDSRFLPVELQNHAEAQPTGWVFYKHILCKHPSQTILVKNTIVLSALADTFKKITPREELEDIVAIISKRDSDNLEQLFEALKSLE